MVTRNLRRWYTVVLRSRFSSSSWRSCHVLGLTLARVCDAQMRELNHENINSFIGLCVDVGHVCVVTKFCHRGSLQVSQPFIEAASRSVSRSVIEAASRSLDRSLRQPPGQSTVLSSRQPPGHSTVHRGSLQVTRPFCHRGSLQVSQPFLHRVCWESYKLRACSPWTPLLA